MSESRGNARPQLTEASEAPKSPSGARFLRLSQLRKWRDCEQVAAVCYRHRGGVIEFLLVRTRGGERRTFPKGSAERGLTQAQAAALEAFEEAGVHGRIEENAFSRYILRKREDAGTTRKFIRSETPTNAYLCEVSRLSAPQESGRNRTWFPAEDARKILREGREKSDGAQLARVINRAVARIQKLDQERRAVREPENSRRFDPGRDAFAADALRKVKFDFAEAYGVAAKSLIPFRGSRLTNMQQQSSRLLGQGAYEPSQCEVLEFGSSRRKTPKALGSGNL